MYLSASAAGVAVGAVAELARHQPLHVAQKHARRADRLKSRAIQEHGSANLSDAAFSLRQNWSGEN